MRGVVLGAAALTGVLVTGSLVLARTQAAFTSSTVNPGNAWQAGTVTIGDDDSGAAMFSASGLLPGDTGTKCIKVSYSGNVSSSVKLYAASSSGALAPYVNLVIDEGSGAGDTGSYAGGCSGFSGSTVFSGTVSGFASASSSFATGVGSFAPSSAGNSRVYRFTWTLDAAAPSGAQGTSSTVAFQWESKAGT